MSTNPSDPGRTSGHRIGPRLAGVLVGGGVVLLMLFALVSGERGRVPGLALAAGMAAISTIVWILRRIVTAVLPDETDRRASTPDPQAAGNNAESEYAR